MISIISPKLGDSKFSSNMSMSFFTELMMVFSLFSIVFLNIVFFTFSISKLYFYPFSLIFSYGISDIYNGKSKSDLTLFKRILMFAND